jgi:hypothetical protein
MLLFYKTHHWSASIHWQTLWHNVVWSITHHWSASIHWQALLSHKVVSSTPHDVWEWNVVTTASWLIRINQYLRLKIAEVRNVF